jgi:hypothetical protein
MPFGDHQLLKDGMRSQLRLLNNYHILVFGLHAGTRELDEKLRGVFKNARPARPQPLGRAEHTEEVRENGQGASYLRACASKRFTAQPRSRSGEGRERRWRHFSTLPKSIILESPSLSDWASSSWSRL